VLPDRSKCYENARLRAAFGPEGQGCICFYAEIRRFSREVSLAGTAYTSPEALSRAFQRQFGANPADIKRAKRVA